MRDVAELPVLLLARLLDYGGIESQISKYCRNFSSVGIRAHVACMHPGGFHWELIQSAGVPTLSLPIRSLHSASAVAAALRLRRYCRSHRIRVLHAFDLPADLYGIPLARLLGLRAAIASELWQRDRIPPVQQVLLNGIDRIASGVVVNCEATARRLVAECRIPASRIHVCPNGIETDVFHPRSRTRVPSLKSASAVIGAVAIHREVKNLSLLVRAFAEVWREAPGIRLAIVGDGPTKPDLLALADRLGIAGACVFEPATKEPAVWMRSIDVFVLCSRSEGLSNSLLEAMACGCCPVASRVGGSPEVIADGVSGMLFESGNVAQLVSALRTLIFDEDLRCRIAQEAVRCIQSRLTIGHACERLAAVYRALVGQERFRERHETEF